MRPIFARKEVFLAHTLEEAPPARPPAPAPQRGKDAASPNGASRECPELSGRSLAFSFAWQLS